MKLEKKFLHLFIFNGFLNHHNTQSQTHNINFFTGILSALISGIFAGLSYPPFNLFFLSFIAYVPVFTFFNSALSNRKLFFLGWLTDFIRNFIAFFWIKHTLVSMSSLSPSIGFVGLVGYAAFQALSVGIVFYVGSKILKVSSGKLGYLIIPALWIIMERWFPAIFVLYTGNALSQFIPFIQFADIAGVAGLSFILIMINFWLAQSISFLKFKPAILSLILFVFVLIYGFIRLYLPFYDNNSKNIQVIHAGFIQPNILPKIKLKGSITQRINVVERELGMFKQLVKKKPDFVVFSEGAFPFYFQDKRADKLYSYKEPKLLSQRFFNISENAHVPVIVGSLRVKNKLLSNTALIIEGNKKYQVYIKNRLVPFGERVPFKKILDKLKIKVKNMSNLNHGNDPGAFVIKNIPISLSLCYEAIFPAFIHKSVVKNKASLLVNITNDEWFGKKGAPQLHLQAQLFRAIENRIPLLRVANTGISCYVDMYGRVHKKTELFKPISGIYEIPMQHTFSLFRFFGDYLPWISLIFIFILIFRGMFLLHKKVSLN